MDTPQALLSDNAGKKPRRGRPARLSPPARVLYVPIDAPLNQELESYVAGRDMPATLRDIVITALRDFLRRHRVVPEGTDKAEAS